jgi:AAA domain
VALFERHHHLPIGGHIAHENVSGSNAADTPQTGAIDDGETNRIATSPRRSKAISRTAAEIELKPTDWLWPERVPMNAITVLAGDPGLGKSLLTINLVAKLTRGEFGGQLGDAIMLTAEDPLAQTVRPRLEAAGADIARVHFGAICRDGFETPILLPDDVQALRGLVLEREAGLVVIDPLMAHLGGVINSWKDQMIRQALAPLHAMAEETGAAVLVVAHLNKGQGTDPLQRLGGSIGIPAAARSVLLLGRDPDEPDGNRRILAQAKSNLGPLSPSLAFVVEGVSVTDTGIEAGVIREVGTSPHGAEDLLSIERRERGARLADAMAFLDDELQKGPSLVKEVTEKAQRLGITKQTLKRAREQLGVETKKLDFDRGWEWRLSSDERGEDGK